MREPPDPGPAISASDLVSSAGRGLLIAVAAGLVLGALGPFGTYERLPAVERFGFWLTCLVVGMALHVPAYWAARWVAYVRRWPALPVVLASALVAALPMTLMVNGIAVSMLNVSRVDTVPMLYPLVLAISFPAQLVTHMVLSRRSAGAVKGYASAQAPLQSDLLDQSAIPATAEPVAQATAPPVPVPALSQSSSPQVRFFARIPARLGRELRALEMEDHYLRIHTALGSHLVLMRMQDAVAELDGLEGLRVHRSWWVARSAVESADRDGKTMRLMLKGGLVVPVARDRQGEVRAAGWPMDRLSQMAG